jgi:hypothetical protein
VVTHPAMAPWLDRFEALEAAAPEGVGLNVAAQSPGFTVEPWEIQ